MHAAVNCCSLKTKALQSLLGKVSTCEYLRLVLPIINGNHLEVFLPHLAPYIDDYIM